MNIIYLTMAEINETSGVYKKISSQIKAMKDMGNSCKLVQATNDRINVFDTEGSPVGVDLDDNNLQKLLDRTDLCYARYELLRHKLYKKVLTRCKASHVFVIVEIPTYPPYQENLARMRNRLENKKYFNAGKTLVGTLYSIINVYRLVNLSNVMCIVGDNKKFLLKKTIRIENGIDVNQNPFSPPVNGTILRIITVSNFSIWNGYDRVIIGLHNYTMKTGKRDIKVIFVGDLKKAKDLVQQVHKLGVSDMVHFTGLLSGSALDSAYDSADIALGALGNHRRKVFSNSSLKAKEYAARGKLMILSDAEGADKFIINNALIVPDDETPLDFKLIKNWFDRIPNKEVVAQATRKYAEEHFGWEIQMRKVLSTYITNQQ